MVPWIVSPLSYHYNLAFSDFASVTSGERIHAGVVQCAVIDVNVGLLSSCGRVSPPVRSCRFLLNYIGLKRVFVFFHVSHHVGW